MRRRFNLPLSVALWAAPIAALAQPRPFGNVTLQELIGKGIRSVVGVLGSVSLVMFVYGGFLWMTAQGSEERVKKAKSTLLYSSLGIVLTFLSYSLVAFILQTVETAATSGSVVK
jgi:hypothetical protein